MYKYEDQKEMRRAINGRMITMVAGLFLVLTAVTSTLINGINFFMIAKQASEGTKEAVDAIEQAHMSITQVRGIGAATILAALIEAGTGGICAKFSNRLNKVKVCLYANITVIAAELLYQVFLLSMGMLNPFAILSSLLMPLCLLWGITRLMKIAKHYPDRTFAVEPDPRKGQRKAQAQPQNKNLMARAKAQVKDEQKAAAVVDEVVYQESGTQEEEPADESVEIIEETGKDSEVIANETEDPKQTQSE